jgi:uncharacterized protein YeaO (DUF488 family)
MSRQNIAIKRIYEEPEPDDGVRVLVDRLWPRGIKKENASIDFWLKEVAPAINCASGSNMSQKNFQSFASTTRQSYTHQRGRQRWKSCTNLLVKDRSPWSLQPETVNIIMLLFCGMY